MILMKAKLSRLAQFVALIAGIILCSYIGVDAGSRKVDADTECKIYRDDEFNCYRLRLPSTCKKTDDNYIYNCLDNFQVSKLCVHGRNLYAVVDASCIHLQLDENRAEVLPQEPQGLNWLEPEEFWKNFKR